MANCSTCYTLHYTPFYLPASIVSPATWSSSFNLHSQPQTLSSSLAFPKWAHLCRPLKHQQATKLRPVHKKPVLDNTTITPLSIHFISTFLSIHTPLNSLFPNVKWSQLYRSGNTRRSSDKYKS